MDVEEVPKSIIQRRKAKNRKNKTILVFDEDARREYLTGFRKRKNERRKKAQLENEQKVKNEKHALKKEMREMVLKSDRHRLPEVEEFLKSTVHDLPEHTVTVTDMSDSLKMGPDVSTDSDAKQDLQEQEEKSETPEEKDAQGAKKKKLIKKLVQVSNLKSKKVKRLGKKQFRQSKGNGGIRTPKKKGKGPKNRGKRH